MIMSITRVTVIGAGLAGSEAAWQIAIQGVPVTLYEMRPGRKTPAHHTDKFAELVCSNSLRANGADQRGRRAQRRDAQARFARSSQCATAHAVPAGGALAVDRDGFSGEVTEALQRTSAHRGAQ